MSFITRLIESIGNFFEKLFKDTADGFNNLPKEQQDAILNGVQASQIIKNNIGQGKVYVADLIAVKLGLSNTIAQGLVDTITKDLGLDDFTTDLADKVQTGITDLAHNSLFESIAKFAASFLGAGSVNWITLGLGVVEYAYQKLKGDGVLVETIDRNKAGNTKDGDPVSPPTGPKP